MTVKKLLILFCILCSGLQEMKAQWDTQMSNYWVVKQVYNPAFTGQGSLLNLSILGRQQWVGVENAPKTFWVSAETPIRFMEKTHGVGVNMSNDQVGLFSNTYINGQYAYKKKFGKNTFNIGIQAGLASIGFDATRLYNPKSGAHSSSDEALPTSSEKASGFDMALGITWLSEDYYAGLSSTHLLSPRYDLGEKFSSYIPRTYYFIAGGNIHLANPLYLIQPSTLVKYSGKALQVDLTTKFVYNKLFNIGVSWRKDDAIVFLLGATIKGFNVGYSYDWSTSAISAVSKGSHELYVTYSMPIDLDKRKKRQGSKSIRIL